MFLFKASSADCHDWCAPPPSFPARCPTTVSQQRQQQRREAFPLSHTVDFPQGNFPILPLTRLPRRLPTTLAFLHFSFAWRFSYVGLSLRSWLPGRLQMQPPQTCSSPSLLLFDSSRGSSCLRCGLEVGSALRPIGTMQPRHELAF